MGCVGGRVRAVRQVRGLCHRGLAPPQALVAERLAALHQLQGARFDVLVVAATTAAHRFAPPSWLAARTFDFRKGQALDEAGLRAQLTLAGYANVGQVGSPGEDAVRGGLIDLFPMGSPVPYRVDLFDDEIDSIRTFDPDSQRSLYPVPEVRLLPGREFPMDEPARAKFRHRWRELLEGDPTKSRIYKDMGNGVATAGIEYYLPLFFEQTATVFDYLGDNATVVLHGDLEPAFQRFWQDTRERYRLVQGDPERPALPPEAFTPARFDTQLEEGMVRFLGDRTRNRMADGKLEVSQIFKWFREDFEKGNKGFSKLEDVFAKYAEQLADVSADREKIKAKSVSITHLDYDWSLNDLGR